jgi:hypothetical protein
VKGSVVFVVVGILEVEEVAVEGMEEVGGVVVEGVVVVVEEGVGEVEVVMDMY